MSKFGLSDDNLEVLRQIFVKLGDVEKVVIFGSRATGAYKRESDVDMAIWQKGGSDVVPKLYTYLEETTLPFFFDIVDYVSLGEDKLKVAIDRDGIVMWEKDVKIS